MLREGATRGECCWIFHYIMDKCFQPCITLSSILQYSSKTCQPTVSHIHNIIVCDTRAVKYPSTSTSTFFLSPGHAGCVGEPCSAPSQCHLLPLPGHSCGDDAGESSAASTEHAIHYVNRALAVGSPNPPLPKEGPVGNVVKNQLERVKL